MPFEWFIALRYMRDARGQTILILAAVSVGVSVLVFLSALIGGLQASLIDKTLGSQAHVTLRMPREEARALTEPSSERAIARLREGRPQRLRSIDQWPAVITEVEKLPGVIAASPSVTGAAFAVRADAKNAVVVRGVEPERFRAIIDVEASLVAGRFELDGDDVAIGSKLAEELGTTVGDKIRIRSSEGVELVATVRGIFRLGNEGVDGTWALTSLRQAQNLYDRRADGQPRDRGLAVSLRAIPLVVCSTLAESHLRQLARSAAHDAGVARPARVSRHKRRCCDGEGAGLTRTTSTLSDGSYAAM